MSHLILREGLSNKVIQPGVTTTEDVVWWYRQRITDHGLDTWFHPTVDIQRTDTGRFDHLRTLSKRPGLKSYYQVICCMSILVAYLSAVKYRYAGTCLMSWNPVKPKCRYLQKVSWRLIDFRISLPPILKAGLTGNEILANALKQAASRRDSWLYLYSSYQESWSCRRTYHRDVG